MGHHKKNSTYYIDGHETRPCISRLATASSRPFAVSVGSPVTASSVDDATFEGREGWVVKGWRGRAERRAKQSTDARAREKEAVTTTLGGGVCGDGGRRRPLAPGGRSAGNTQTPN